MKLFRWSLALTFAIAVVAFSLSLLTIGEQGRLRISSAIAAAPVQKTTLKVASLNIAHGRADSFSQLFLNRQDIKQNLTSVAQVLNRTRADIFALQEIDSPSIWSGEFDHASFLSDQLGTRNHITGHHVEGLGLAYGTALLSSLPLTQPRSHRFQPSPPTMSKGFVVATVKWPSTEQTVDVVSLHLDFSRDSIRHEQIQELITLLKQRQHPVIILGDFNTDEIGPGSSLQTLKQALQLKTFAPERDDLITFTLTGKRLDWILVSNNINFIGYQTLPDVVSDHLAVVAELQLTSKEAL